MKQLVGIPESMLIPLIARAKEYENEKPIIKDALSKKIFDGLDDMYKMLHVMTCLKLELVYVL